MRDALAGLGARIDEDGADWVVTPGACTGGDVHCGLAGTVMRFLPAVAALADGPVRFDGDASALARPMGPVLTALRALGRAGRRARRAGPPAVHGARPRPAARRPGRHRRVGVQPVRLRAAARRPRGSTQGLTLRHTGRHAAEPAAHRDDGRACCARPASRSTTRGPTIWRVAPGPIAGRDVARRAGPVQRRAVPVRGAGRRRHGARARAGRRAPRSPAACCRGSCERMGATTSLDGDVLTRDAAPARSTASTWTCTPPARSPRPSPRSPPWPTPPPGCAASRTCAATRPTGSPRSRPRSRALGGQARADVGRPGHHAAPADRRHVAHVRGPPDGDRGRARRAARCRASRWRTSRRPPRRCPTSSGCGAACWPDGRAAPDGVHHGGATTSGTSASVPVAARAPAPSSAPSTPTPRPRWSRPWTAAGTRSSSTPTGPTSASRSR